MRGGCDSPLALYMCTTIIQNKFVTLQFERAQSGTAASDERKGRMALDILIAVVLIAAVIFGSRRGIIVQVGNLAALVIAILGARVFGPKLVPLTGENAGVAAEAMCYIIAFIVIYVAVWLIARLFRKVVKTVHLGLFDRICGAIFQAVKWLLVLSLVLNVWILVVGKDEMRAEGKPWRGLVIDFAPKALGFITESRTDSAD